MQDLRPLLAPRSIAIIRRIGHLALDLEDRVAEVEIKPLMVTPTGAIALDAVVAVRAPGAQS